MSRRDSDSKRRHSRFDRQPSPKRYRRDGKQERDRETTTTANVENGDHKHRRQLPDAQHHSKPQTGDLHRDSTDNKPNDHYEAPKHEPDPPQVPRSLSSFQHDERGDAGQISRSSGQRKSGERGWWKDSKNRHNERPETSQGRKQRDEKSKAKPDDNTSQKRDGFSERKVDPLSTSRKRPAFSEKNIPLDSGDAIPAATVTVKSSQIDQPPERNDRKKERSSNPYHLDRPEKQFADDRALNKGEARRDGFPARERYGGNGGISGNGNYRGRDKFNGRQGYRPNNTQNEKWKHDLYQEVDKDPIPQNEDDQIAKLEALLAS